MDQNFLKITYHLGVKKMNAYLKMPSPTYHVLKKEIEFCLFEERKQDRCEIRTYWIDEDRDEIEILNQCDYEIFMAKRSNRLPLQVSPADMDTEEHGGASKQTMIPPAVAAYDVAVHDHVECDSCLMAPIIGFRYKCIQCANYDLCENCESKHIHSEHMMIRMPTNNCPNVVEAYVTGRSAGRRHGKRYKPSCQFVKNGLSVAVDDDDDDEAKKSAGGKNAEQSSPTNGKERHHGRKNHDRHQRNNIFSHLYEMMNDLAEGGGGAAADHAMDEASTSSETTGCADGPQPTTTTAGKSTSDADEIEKTINPLAAAAAAAVAAKYASEQAQETAAKAAEIAAKVAHQTALNASKNMAASASSTNSATTNENGEKEKSTNTEKVDATTSPSFDADPANVIPIVPISLAQLLDPQLLKNGVQILNNFSDMFAKMLDPMENTESSSKQNDSNLRKNSSTNTSVSSNLNSMGLDKKSNEEKSIEKNHDEINENSHGTNATNNNQTNIDLIKSSSASTTGPSNLNSMEDNKATDENCIEKDQEKTKENKQTDTDTSSLVEIDDLGSESESENEGFIKIVAPKNGNTSTPISTAAESTQSTPNVSLNRSDVVDFVQIGADLKAFIANEAANDSTKIIESATESVDKADEALTSAASVTSATSASTSVAKAATAPKVSKENRAVIVHHADNNINNAVHAMMAMGFSNDEGWLTQLLECVNGNIPDALDLMSSAQLSGNR